MFHRFSIYVHPLICPTGACMQVRYSCAFKLYWVVTYVCHQSTLGAYVTKVKYEMHQVVRGNCVSGFGKKGFECSWWVMNWDYYKGIDTQLYQFLILQVLSMIVLGPKMPLFNHIHYTLFVLSYSILRTKQTLFPHLSPEYSQV